jgi:hypothetical protein
MIYSFTPPTRAQIEAFLEKRRLTRELALEMAGLPPQGGPGKGRMSYAVWFTLHAKTMLPLETLDRIDAEMQVSCGEMLL